MSRLKPICVKNKRTLRRNLLCSTNVYTHESAVCQDAADVEDTNTVVTSTGKAAVLAVVNILNKTGLHNHNLQFDKSVQNSKRIIGRLAHFIMWSYKLENNTDISLLEPTILDWFTTLVLDKYTLLLEYSSHLNINALKAPNTISSYVTDIESCLLWITTFAPMPLRQSTAPVDGIKKVCELVRKQQGKRNRKARSHKTWDQKVQDRKIPAGGLPVLRAAVLSELPWALGVRSACIDDSAYRRFMRVLFAAVYVFSVNGRQSAVVDMKYGQASELVTEGFATSRKFKTHSKYGYQPVTLGEVSHKLLQHYVTVVRPQVRPAAYSHPDEPLFLTYRGAPEKNVGRLVTLFFTNKCGLSVSTTGIRSLVETTMHKRFQKGEISEAQRTAVQNINGHSSNVTKDFYLLEDRVADVHAARAAFQLEMDENIDRMADEMTAEDVVSPQNLASSQWALFDTPLGSPLPAWSHFAPATPLSSPPAGFTPAPLQWSPAPQRPAEYRATPAVPQWGTQHPDYKSTKSTAQWTLDEKNFVGGWCTKFSTQFPDNHNAVAQCLKHIQTRPELVAIFHEHHTLNSTRLRAGWRTYQLHATRSAAIETACGSAEF